MTLAALVGALGEVAADLRLIFPVHPRTRGRLKELMKPAGLLLVEPQGYLDFLKLQSNARLVLTDSGGIQEETTALGVPCLTLRENTERPITISEGTNRLVGTDPENIVRAAAETMVDPPVARCPALWDGRAGSRIAEALLEHLSLAPRPRPTDIAE